MATICFRPPPLPPSKKSSPMINGNNRQRVPAKQNPNSHGLLSSTYLSFRDPADEDEIEMSTFKCNSKSSGGKRCKKLTHTNSLSRASRDIKVVITRSHSDGNIDKKGLSTISINRYMKVLSGSWRNLLNCKCCQKASVVFLTAPSKG